MTSLYIAGKEDFCYQNFQNFSVKKGEFALENGMDIWYTGVKLRSVVLEIGGKRDE